MTTRNLGGRNNNGITGVAANQIARILQIDDALKGRRVNNQAVQQKVNGGERENPVGILPFSFPGPLYRK